MGNVHKVDRTLALNEMIYYVRKDAELRRRFTEDLDGLARQFGLSTEELDALKDKDVRRLNDMGVHQYYIPQILRLFFGTKSASNVHPAMEAFRRAYPEEFARAEEAAARPRAGGEAWGRGARGGVAPSSRSRSGGPLPPKSK